MDHRRANHKLPWTEEDISLLSQFRADGWPDVEIARHLGRTVLSVQKQVRTLGLFGGPYPEKQLMSAMVRWSPLDIEFLRDRHHRWGMSTREIAKEMGRTIANVHQKKVKLGLTPNNLGDAAAGHIGSKMKGHSATAEIARMEAISVLEARIAARKKSAGAFHGHP